MVAGPMGLKPGKGCCLIEGGRQVGCRLAPIAQIHRIAGAVFGKAGGSANHGPFPGALAAFCLDVKEQLLLESHRTESTQHHQTHPVLSGIALHGQQGPGRIAVQGQPRGHRSQLRVWKLRVGEMAQQATIRTHPGVEATDRRQAEQVHQKPGPQQQQPAEAKEEAGTADAQAQKPTVGSTRRWGCPSGDRYVVQRPGARSRRATGTTGIAKVHAAPPTGTYQPPDLMRILSGQGWGVAGHPSSSVSFKATSFLAERFSDVACGSGGWRPQWFLCG